MQRPMGGAEALRAEGVALFCKCRHGLFVTMGRADLLAMLLFAGPASACDWEPGFERSLMPMFVAAFIVVLLAVLVLAALLRGGLHFLAGKGAGLSFLALVGVVLAAGLCLLGVLVLPHFQAVFADMGVDLPAHTALLMSFRYLLVLPLAWLVLRMVQGSFAAADRRQHGRFLLFELVLLALVLWSAYAPIFKLC